MEITPQEVRANAWLLEKEKRNLDMVQDQMFVELCRRRVGFYSTNFTNLLDQVLILRELLHPKDFEILDWLVMPNGYYILLMTSSYEITITTEGHHSMIGLDPTKVWPASVTNVVYANGNSCSEIVNYFNSIPKHGEENE